MNFIIYDKHGIAVHGINVEPTLSKFQVEDALRDYLRLTGPDCSVDFNLTGFRTYLFYTLGVNSSEFKFGRLNIKV